MIAALSIAIIDTSKRRNSGEGVCHQFQSPKGRQRGWHDFWHRHPSLKQVNEMERRSDIATLIAFYSRAGENCFGGTCRRISVGNTEKAAEMLADLQSKARPEVLNLPDDLDAYDEIYLGYPNYWGTMPMAVYTFLEDYDFAGKTIRPFCTHEGSGLSRTVRDIQTAAPGAAVAKGLAIYGSGVDHAKAALEK